MLTIALLLLLAAFVVTIAAALVALGLDPAAPSFSLDDDTLTITVPDG